MKFKQRILLVAFCTVFVTISGAQHKRYRIQNSIGLTGGLTQYNIITDNFDTKKGNGWLVGASATVDIPHKFYNVSYIIQLAENPLEIATRASNSNTETTFTEYKIFTAQLGFLGHLKLIKKHLFIDVGPMLQYNSNLELNDDAQEDYFIQNYNNLQAKDIEDISNFNVNGLVGLSLGFERFHLKAHYIYGFLDTFNKLNEKNLDTTGGMNSFKGNQSMFVFGAMFLF